jgi:hypothetical protein
MGTDSWLPGGQVGFMGPWGKLWLTRFEPGLGVGGSGLGVGRAGLGVGGSGVGVGRFGWAWVGRGGCGLCRD